MINITENADIVNQLRKVSDEFIKEQQLIQDLNIVITDLSCTNSKNTNLKVENPLKK